jgi:hypothetical protein
MKRNIQADHLNLLQRKDWVARLFAVVADGFDRASGHGFFAETDFFFVLRLLENVAVTSIVIAGEIGRCGLAAEITVNALVVHVERASGVLGILVCEVCHCFEELN